MTSGKPMLNRGVKRVDTLVGPTLDSIVRSEAMGLGLAVALRLRRDVGHRIERSSRHVLHALNLPTGSDVKRLLTHIAAVERDLRELNKTVERALPSVETRRAQR